MVKSLLIEKAKEKVILKLGDVSNNAIAKYFHEQSITQNTTISKRTFVRHLKDIEINRFNKINLQEPIIYFYLQFLGFDSLNDFKNLYKDEITKLEVDLALNSKIPEQESLIAKTKNSTSQKSLSLISISLILIVILGVIGVLYLNSIDSNLQPNSFNFNADNIYFYYLDQQGKIRLVNNIDKYPHAEPLRPYILDQYFYEQGVDTTSQEVKMLKANYFNENANLITDQEIKIIKKKPLSNNVSHDEASANNHKIKSDSKNITPKPKLSLVFSDEEDLNEDIAAIIQKEMNKKYSISLDLHYDAEYQCNIFTTYSYTYSKMFENKHVCHLKIKYEIVKINDKSLVNSYNKQFDAIGFSNQSAKENAVQKFEKMYLKNE